MLDLRWSLTLIKFKFFGYKITKCEKFKRLLVVASYLSSAFEPIFYWTVVLATQKQKMLMLMCISNEVGYNKAAFRPFFPSHLQLAELFDSFIPSLADSFNLSFQIFYVCLQLLLGCSCLGPLLPLILQLSL